MGWDDGPYDDAPGDGDEFTGGYDDFDEDFEYGGDYDTGDTGFDSEFDGDFDGAFDDTHGVDYDPEFAPEIHAGSDLRPDPRPGPLSDDSNKSIKRKKPTGASRKRPVELSRWQQMQQGMRRKLHQGVLLLLLIVLVAFGFAAATWLFGDDPAGDTPGTLPTDALEAGTLPPESSWPRAVIAVPHTIPAMIKNALALAGEQHGYAFEGQAGARWLITVAAQDDTLDPVVDLYGPDGVLLATADDRSATDLDAELAAALSTSGTYRVLVRSSRGGTTVGAYLLSVWPLD